MNELAPILFLALLIAIVVGGNILKRKASAWGEKKGKEYTAKKIPEIRQLFRSALWIRVLNESTVVTIINEVVDSKRDYKALETPNTWGIRFAEHGDIKFTLVETADSEFLLKCIEFRDYMGAPAGGPFWLQLLQRVEKKLTEAGIEFEKVERPDFEAAEQVSEKNFIWREAPVQPLADPA